MKTKFATALVFATGVGHALAHPGHPGHDHGYAEQTADAVTYVMTGGIVGLIAGVLLVLSLRGGGRHLRR